MLKLESWKDFFATNRELFDDDYNHGQALIVKTKKKSSNGNVEVSTSYKLGQADD